MRKGDRVVKVIKDKPIELEFIGQGQFTEAFRNGSGVYLFTNEDSATGDYSKQAMSLFTGNNPHLPDIEWVEGTDDYTVYKSRYYEPITAKHKEAWTIGKYLEKERIRLWNINSYKVTTRQKEWFEVMQELVDTVDVTDLMRDALQNLLYAGMNYDNNVAFEFAKKNLCVNEEGLLVFIDCIWFPDKAKANWDKKAAKKRYR